jgi:3-oxo-5-alpha-steroid 4-dehydrogenase 1
MFITNTILNLLVLIWSVIGVIIFFTLLKIKAPYGRFSKKGWGKLFESRIGFLLMEFMGSVFFLVLFVIYSIKLNKINLILVIIFILWQFAYVYRGFIYPFFRKKGKKIPLSIIFMAMIFNSINSFLIVTSIFLSINQYTQGWLFDIRFISGLSLFIIGYYANVKSDIILRKLRENKKDEIPRGFLFNYVSSPHYFSEIIKWIGFALLIWTWAGLSFVIWTCANLIPRAIAHHKWYHKNLKNYPKNRTILIPKIF